MDKRSLKKTVGLLLAVCMSFLALVGTFSAFADESTEGVSADQPQEPSLEVTEDGHIDEERLKQWVDTYLHADGWDAPQCAMSIGIWYPGTDETWFYNPDEWMYGVNWSKLPISMLFAEKLAAGELTNDSVITGITLEYALQTVLENSSGPSFYSMVTYLGGNTVSNCADLVPQYAGLPEDYYIDDFYQKSYYTARIMTEVTKTLYLGGDERFPKVLEYMKESQPWDMFKRDENIRVNLNASQTHAASWGDGAGDYIHCTGVIYTPTPIVLTVMTKNISDLDIIGGVAGHIALVVTEMDARQQLTSTAESSAAAPTDVENQIVPNESPVPDTVSGEMRLDMSDPSAQPQDTPLISEENSETVPSLESSSQELKPDEIASPTPRLWLLGISALILLSLICIAVSRGIGKKRN